MGVLPRIVAAVALLAVSACTVVRLGGVPVADDSVPEELTAEAAFGDFATVAPCSLTDPSAFDTFGSATFGEPESTLDYCTVLVRTTGGAAVSVNVGLFEEATSTFEIEGLRVRDVERGMWIARRSGPASPCAQLLVFPDGVTVEVRAYESSGAADTCSIVETGMDHLIEVVLDGEVAHRSPAPNSLVDVDPCDLLGVDDIGALPGLAGMREGVHYPGRHTCRWAKLDLSVAVTFGAGRKPAAHRALPVAGRPTATTPVELPDWSYCTVETGHIPFTELAGVTDQVELASVFVHTPPGQANAGCAAAQAVAEVLWPQLPAA